MDIGIIRKDYLHGMAEEHYLNPPNKINYHIVDHYPNQFIDKILIFKPKKNINLYQSMEFLPYTNQNYILYLCDVSGSACFDISGYYPDRKSRIQIFKNIVKKPNCKKMVFSSKIGKSTLNTYAKIKDKDIISKSTIIYPGIRKFNFKKKKSDKIRLLFVGPDFYRKGGKQVIQAFLKLQKKYDNLQLTIFSNLESKNYYTDFFPKDHKKILSIIHKNKDIISNSIINREKLLKNHYPNADVFVMPTLQDNFGFALLEAQAFGLPTISTNYFAIPEIIQHNKSGFLINIDKNMTDSIYNNLKILIEDNSLRNKISKNALKNAKNRFSMRKYNKKIKGIYESIK